MTSDIPVVTSIIVTYNSSGYVGDALDALSSSFRDGYLECVVVDNASTDGTVDFIRENYCWVTLVESEKNIGFGRGCNLGFRSVHTPYILIQNPDAIICYSDLKILVNFMDLHAKAAISAPAIIENNTTIQEAGLMTTPASLIRSSLGISNHIPEQRPVIPEGDPFKTTWVCGALMMIRADVFRSIKGFDPRFFLYFEETDLCRRVMKEKNEIWAVGKAKAHHIGGASARATGNSMEFDCITEHFYKSRFYYLVKHFGWVRACVTEVFTFILQFIRLWCKRGLRNKQNSDFIQKRPFLKFPVSPEIGTNYEI